MKPITINGISINPSAPKPMLAGLALHNVNARDSDYIVVQTRQPLDKAAREALAKAGAEIIEAVPGDAYVCHFPKTDLERVRKLKFVEWAEVYPQAVKIAPSQRDLPAQRGGVDIATAAMRPPGALDDARKTVDVVLHRNANPKKAARAIAAAAHLSPDQVRVLPGKVRLLAKMRRLPDLAALDEVRHIEEVLPRKLLNAVARQILRTPQGANPSGGARSAR